VSDVSDQRRYYERMMDEIAIEHRQKVDQLQAENAALRTQLADVTESMGRVEEQCARLRELLAETLMDVHEYAEKYGIESSYDAVNEHLDARMRKLGVEVDDGNH
jgi:predicted  nucleic acid-binding Zn-ribbon protein